MVNFSPPFPFSKKQVYIYRTSDVGSPLIIVLMSLILLAFLSCILPSYQVASEDPTMVTELEKEWKRERFGDIWCLHQEVKTFLAAPTDFHWHLINQNISHRHSAFQERLKKKVFCFSSSHSVSRQRKPCRKWLLD